MIVKKLTLLSLIAAMSLGVVGCGDDCPDDMVPDGGAGTGPVLTADFSIRCHIKGVADLPIPVSMEVEMSEPLVASQAADATINVDTTIEEMIASLILGFGTDPIVVDRLEATVAVANADVTTVPMDSASVPFDMYFCSDCAAMPPVAQENILSPDAAVETVTNDGSATLEFTLEGLDVNLDMVPALGSLNVLVPSTQERCDTAADCTLMTDDCQGEDAMMGLQGWCAPNDANIEVFCELPADGSETVSFPVPTPTPAP